MSTRPTVNNTMRIYHRYLGFFLAGIMAVYAFSGVIMIFRNTSFLKKESVVTKTVEPGLSAEALGKSLKVKELHFTGLDGDVQTFKQGTYNTKTGTAVYKASTLPKLIEKLNHLHKASTKDPLFYLNIFFGVSLLFFVISSFWMFMPKTTIFKKGLYFTLAGIVLTVVLLMV